MSRDASTIQPLGPEDRFFRLGWGELAILQEECDAGPYVVLDRLLSGRWRIQDISSVVRLGLVGGGRSNEEALKLVRTYVEVRPPVEHLFIAQKILSAAVAGSAEEIVGGKGEAANPDRENQPSREENSDLPPSTEPAR